MPIKNSDEEPEVISLIGGNDDSYIKTHIVMAKNHHVFFDDEIGDPKDYRSLRNMLYVAEEQDRFTFFINSVGGQLFTTLAIIEAMKRTQATIQSVVEGECMSAATLLLLNSDEITVTDSAVIMCHSASHGVAGNTQGVKRQADFVDRQWRELERKTYAGFLTDDEMVDMSKGVEYFFDATESRKRLKRWAAIKVKK